MIRTIRSFFGGLRGKLILTYTLVTVLALMALEVLAILALMLLSSLTQVDRRQYLNDVIDNLYPQASDYLQPQAVDPAGLQEWLEEVYESGYASPSPMNVFDSPAAAIVPDDPLLVLAPDGTVLAQVPLESGSLIGRHYSPPDDPSQERILDQALAGSYDSLRLTTTTATGKTRLAVPVFQDDGYSEVVGVILLTLEPAPSMILTTLPVYLGWVLGTGLLLLAAVAPFGALFGLIMSRGLTHRLEALTLAADAWSEGDFRPRPLDHSKDEIGMLATRLRNMAERIQTLLQSQQELAALEERNRLARELHDTVKQQAFATLMQVRAARNLLDQDPAAVSDLLAQAEELIKTSQQELSRLIAEMRPAALEGQGLSSALQSFLERWSQQTRIPAEFKVANDQRLPLECEQVLYRVAQEALANVARHSRASTVQVYLGFEAGEVRLLVSDNGIGFDIHEESQGFGRESMRERLAQVGGRLEVNSIPQRGTHLSARIPLNEKEAAHGT